MGGSLPSPRVFAGHAVTTTTKGVCKLCNKHWMSRLETAAKPFLEPMLLGKHVVLNLDAQRILLQWIVLKMMVWEQTHLASAVFTRDQTLAFATDRTIPKKTAIWLFFSDAGTMRARVTRAFASLWLPSEVPTYFPVGANTQTVLFRVGQLVVFMTNTRLASVELGEFRQSVAKRLWPSRRRFLLWPPSVAVDAEQETHLANTLTRYLGRPNFTVMM
jgi:hypothetical protein